MRKKLLLAGLFCSILGFVSCSSDNDSNGNPDSAKLELFTSSNTSGTITYTDLLASMPMAKTFTVGSLDADGIYYNNTRDEVIIASRTNNRLEVYGNFRNALSSSATSLMMTASSATGDFTNAREIAVVGDRVVVVQDQAEINGNTNKLLVYQRTTSGFTLEKTFTVGFKLWGITVSNGNLYAVVDLSSDIAVFNSFFSKPNGTLVADKRVSIEGLTRTHGIAYSEQDNVMVLTDVGLATSATDGGIVVIENFNSVFSSTASGGSIALSKQKRIYGPNSLLGNPVDVSYDEQTNKIYVAERLNGGGQVLSFAYPTSAQSDAMPLTARLEPGVTGIYLRRE